MAQVVVMQQQAGQPPPGTVYVIQQQPVVQASNRTPDGRRLGFAHESAMRCGIIQCICGVVEFFMWVGVLVEGSWIGYIGMGVWASALIFVSGGLSVHSARTKNTCPIVASMVMSIICTLLGFCMLSMQALGLGMANNPYFYYWTHRDPTTLKALHTIALLNALVLIVVTIIQSSLACRATCCGPSQQAGVVTYQQGTTVAATSSGVNPQVHSQAQGYPQVQHQGYPQSQGYPPVQPQVHGYPQAQPQYQGYPQAQQPAQFPPPAAPGYPPQAFGYQPPNLQSDQGKPPIGEPPQMNYPPGYAPVNDQPPPYTQS